MNNNTRVYIDPPSGWKYGFPKLYSSTVDGEDIRSWLLLNGYPEKDVDFALNYLRMWEEE
jgi:hypothetical protein